MQPSQLNPNEDPNKDNLALSKVIERNIRMIIHLLIKERTASRKMSWPRFIAASDRAEQRTELYEPGS